MGKKKKASKAPKLVAPEPPGDEWEANMAWDRVAHSGAAPAFFNGSHMAATDNVFNVRYNVEHAVPPAAGLTSSSAGLRSLPEKARALDVYLRAEETLRQARTRQREAAETTEGFQLLQAAEQRHTADESARLEREWASTLRDLDASEADSLGRVERLSAVFFDIMDAAKRRVSDLVVRDAEVEDAFEDRRATLALCEDVTNAYYAEHAAHVHKMEKLQADSAREHAEELERMTCTLQDTAFELLVMASQQDNTSEIQQRRTELLDELQKLQQRTPLTLTEQRDATGGTEALQRLVELEEQKLALAQQRHASLQRAVQALTEAGPPPLELTAAAEPTETTSDAPDLLNEIASLRRELDRTTREIAAEQEKMQHLQNYHFVQLSGSYKPVGTNEVGVHSAANALDEETNAAIRDVVMKSMRALAASAYTARDGALISAGAEGSSELLVPPVDTVQDRLAVQNHIAKQINRLLSGQVPTAPPLTLLSSTPLAT